MTGSRAAWEVRWTRGGTVSTPALAPEQADPAGAPHPLDPRGESLLVLRRPSWAGPDATLRARIVWEGAPDGPVAVKVRVVGLRGSEEYLFGKPVLTGGVVVWDDGRSEAVWLDVPKLGGSYLLAEVTREAHARKLRVVPPSVLAVGIAAIGALSGLLCFAGYMVSESLPRPPAPVTGGGSDLLSASPAPATSSPPPPVQLDVWSGTGAGQYDCAEKKAEPRVVRCERRASCDVEAGCKTQLSVQEGAKQVHIEFQGEGEVYCPPSAGPYRVDVAALPQKAVADVTWLSGKGSVALSQEAGDRHLYVCHDAAPAAPGDSLRVNVKVKVLSDSGTIPEEDWRPTPTFAKGFGLEVAGVTISHAARKLEATLAFGPGDIVPLRAPADYSITDIADGGKVLWQSNKPPPGIVWLVSPRSSEIQCKPNKPGEWCKIQCKPQRPGESRKPGSGGPEGCKLQLCRAVSRAATVKVDEWCSP